MVYIVDKMDQIEYDDDHSLLQESTRSLALERIAQTQDIWSQYKRDGVTGFLFTPARNKKNTMLTVLPSGLTALVTRDRLNQIPKSGPSAMRMLFVMNVMKIALLANRPIRQRCAIYFILRMHLKDPC